MISRVVCKQPLDQGVHEDTELSTTIMYDAVLGVERQRRASDDGEGLEGGLQGPAHETTRRGHEE